MTTTKVQLFIIKRTLNAPRELVWKAWTEPERLKKWFGPKGVTMPECKLDLRPGGYFHYCMQGPDGNKGWGKWVFQEVDPPKKLVLVNSFADEQGNSIPAPFIDKWPIETLSTTTLEERDGKTELTIQWEPYNASEEEIATFLNNFPSMNGGWNGTFEQLEAYLAEEQKA